MQTLDVIVHAVTLASATSRSYELRPVTGTLPPFDAGAHIDVHLDRADGGPALIRPYSLCNSPREKDRYLICVHREDTGRGGSLALHREITVGRRLRVSAPRNLFPLVSARRYVLVAGGIGITPLLSMAETLAARGAPFRLHHYTSSAARAPLAERLAESSFAGRVVSHRGDRGDSVRTGLPGDLLVPDPETAVYVCGPAGFMACVRDGASALGWRPEQLHTERFTPTPGPAPTPTVGASVPHEAGTGFTVRLASTGERYPVPADRTIADVLTAHGVEIGLSCEQGMCGACLTPVLAGEPDHRDEVQSPAEQAANTHITLCCSRAHSAELLLDL